jgi:hypothetical protein
LRISPAKVQVIPNQMLRVTLTNGQATRSRIHSYLPVQLIGVLRFT